MRIDQLYRNINPQNVETFILVTKENLGKRLKPGGVFNLVFKKSWEEGQVYSYKKANIQAAISYLEFLLIEPNDEFENNVRNCLADLFGFYIDILPDPEIKMGIFNVNDLSTFLHFRLAKSIFYENSIPTDLQKRGYLDLPITYFLRLCLEGRIHGFLGIDYIQIDRNPLALSEILKIVPNIISIEFTQEIKWEKINLINDWVNHFMHRNLRPSPWCIHLVFKELEPFFKTGFREFGEIKSHSIYASTFIESKEVFQREFFELLQVRFPNKSVNIKWSGIQEVHLKP